MESGRAAGSSLIVGRDEPPGTPAREALSPLLAPEGSVGRRRARIALAVGCELALLASLTLLAPILLVAAAVVDLALWLRRRKPWMGVRIVVLVWWFLAVELRGLAGILAVWLGAGGPWGRDSVTRRRRTYALQVAWATGHIACFRRLCRVRFEVDGGELVGRGPLVVLTRHASVVDNGLPALVLSRPHGLDLRYVLKSDLEALPTLDVGARWVPTCFVRRGSGDSARQIERVRTLATGLDGERDGVMIYPEGTRFTARKLAAQQARAAAESPELAERVGGLRHILPPRPGGPVALLEEAPHAAVLVCGHVGLEDVHGLLDLWSGAVVGRRVQIRVWRHERHELPRDRDELAAWLYERWQALDDWIDAQLADAPGRNEPVRS